MDLNLKILIARSNIQTILHRLRLTREDIEKNRPTAVKYIEGSKDTEAKLAQANVIFHELEHEARMLGRENMILTRQNMELKQRVQDFENQIKYQNIEI
jgi:hypothetical protein